MSDHMHPEDWERKLPARARTLIASMRREILDLRQACEEIDIKDSNTTVDGSVNDNVPEIGLGKSPRINFYFSDGRRRSIDAVQIYFDQKGTLTVQAGSSLVVRPKATNSCTIGVEDRF